jgi:hypothetical protein
VRRRRRRQMTMRAGRAPRASSAGEKTGTKVEGTGGTVATQSPDAGGGHTKRVRTSVSAPDGAKAYLEG